MKKLIFAALIFAAFLNYAAAYELEAHFAPPDGGYPSTPAVGDIDHDGVPEIIFGTTPGTTMRPSGHLYIITKNSSDIITMEREINLGGAVFAPAIGDLDGDGTVEIVAYVWDGTGKVVAVHPDGTVLWSTSIHLRYGYDCWNNHAPSLGDVNDDGIADIAVVAGPDMGDAFVVVLDGVSGTELWRYNLGRYHIDGECAIMDLDMDGHNEVIAAADLGGYLAVMRGSGTLWWRADTAGNFGVADFDGDGYPEVIVVGGGVIRLFSYNGTLISTIGSPSISAYHGFTIADFDGDGLPEAAVGTSGPHVLAFDYDTSTTTLSLMWDSGDLGVGEWDNPDFNCDGTPDIITISDDAALVILDGETGSVLEPASVSINENEHSPALADVDGDTYSEVIVPSGNGYSGGRADYNRNVLIFGNDGVWGYTRTFWDQLAFWQSNVDSELSTEGGDYTPWLSPMTNVWRSLHCHFPHFNAHLAEIAAAQCSLIYVTVCVTDDDGNYIHDLHIDNFDFYENSDPVYPPNLRQLNECPPGSTKADIVILMDCSTSMDDDIDSLRAHIPVFVSGLTGSDYRISMVMFNGCPEEFLGFRQVITTDFAGPTPCTYIPAAADTWAVDLSEFTCLYDAATYFTSSGSGHEDQLGALRYAAENLHFRPDARHYFLLFTDERPQTADEVPPGSPSVCARAWDYHDEYVDSMVNYALDNDMILMPITPRDGEFEYWWSGGEPATRRNYSGYPPMAYRTGGKWFYLYTPDYSSLVDSITVEIVEDSCCYQFMYQTYTFCDTFVDISVDVHAEGPGAYASDDSFYLGLCPPQLGTTMPEPCGGITSCDRQPMIVQLENSLFGELVPSTVTFFVNGTMFTESDEQLTVTNTTISFAPDTPFEHGDTVVFYVGAAQNTRECWGDSPPCTFYVDIVPPEGYDPFPAIGETLYGDFDTIRIPLRDDFSGVAFDSIDADDILITLGPDTILFDSFYISDGVLNIDGVHFTRDGTVQVCVNLMDTPDYDYCPPNNGVWCYDFLVYFTPRMVWFADTTAAPCDTILIPLIIDGFEMTPIYRMYFEGHFDPAVIIPLDVVTGGYTDGWSVIASNITPDSGTISFTVGGDTISSGGEGTMLYIRSVVPCGAWGGDYCPLVVDSVYFNDGFPIGKWRSGFFLVQWRWTEWLTELRLNRTVNPSDEDLTLAIGGMTYATEGYNPGADLLILPPVPGWVSAYLEINDTLYPYITQFRRDIRGLTPPQRWTIITQGEPNGVIHWNASRLPEGKFYLNSVLDMKIDTIYYYGLNDTLIIDWVTERLLIDSLRLHRGWNLASLPVVPPRYTANEVFPTLPVPPYRYLPDLRTYAEIELFNRGEGFWLYSNTDTTIKLGGIYQTRYNRELSYGWNIIAATAETLSVDTVCTEPAGVLMPTMYAYNSVTHSYYSTSYLIPGEGYWATMTADGIISVPMGGAYCRGSVAERWNWLGRMSVATDGDSAILSFGVGRSASDGLDIADLPLPPVPPESSERGRAFFIRGDFELERDIANQPLWSLYLPADGSIDVVSIPAEAGEVVLLCPQDEKIPLRSGSHIDGLKEGLYLIAANREPIPDFKLAGVYPNPFNTSVRFVFILGKDDRVKLTLHDVGGRLVRRISSDLSAGTHTIIWDGKDTDGNELPSGIYLYRIDTGTHNEIGQVILIR